MKDVIVLGEGAAALSASIECARAGLQTALIGRTPASQYHELPEVSRFGIENIFDDVNSLDLESETKKVAVSRRVIKARAVILANGLRPKKLGLENENKLTGKGISYSVTENGETLKTKKILVVGDGPDALHGIVALSRFSSIFWGVNSSDEFSGPEFLIDEALTCGGLYMIWDSVVTRIIGEDKLDGVYIKNIKLGMENYMHVDCLLVAVGSVPNTSVYKEMPVLNESGFVRTDSNMRTSINGVFAAGMIRETATAAHTDPEADGIAAAKSVQQHLS